MITFKRALSAKHKNQTQGLRFRSFFLKKNIKKKITKHSKVYSKLTPEFKVYTCLKIHESPASPS